MSTESQFSSNKICKRLAFKARQSVISQSKKFVVICLIGSSLLSWSKQVNLGFFWVPICSVVRACMWLPKLLPCRVQLEKLYLLLSDLVNNLWLCVHLHSPFVVGFATWPWSPSHLHATVSAQLLSEASQIATSAKKLGCIWEGCSQGSAHHRHYWHRPGHIHCLLPRALSSVHRLRLMSTNVTQLCSQDS